MKVEQAERTFRPITIVIENEEDYKAFVELFRVAFHTYKYSFDSPIKWIVEDYFPTAL